jgi:hypothetical protein
VNGYAKKMRYGIETTSPHAAKVCFGHKVLRWFYDFEKDIRIEEIIFVYENKERGCVTYFDEENMLRTLWSEY